MVKSNQQQSRQIDIAIITIREDEESAILKRLTNHQTEKRDNQVYAVATVETVGVTPKLLKVAEVRCAEEGERKAQSVANDVIADLDPRAIFVVGIAGGFPTAEFSLGDVVLATRVQDLCLKALLHKTGPQYDVRGTPILKEVEVVLTALNRAESLLADWNSGASIGMQQPSVDLSAKNFYGPTKWRRSLRRLLEKRFGPDGMQSRPPKHVIGALVSSDNLVKEVTQVQKWLSFVRKAVGCEMEMAGVFEAATKVKRAYPVYGIRGISDIIGFKRDDDWTNYACETAAAFTFSLIRTGLVPYESGIGNKRLGRGDAKAEQAKSTKRPIRHEREPSSASNAGDEARAFKLASGFIDRGDVPSAITSILGQRDFEHANPSAQLAIAFTYQKFGYLDEAQRCVDTIFSRRNAGRLSPQDRARAEVIALKVNSQRGEFEEVLRNYRSVLRSLDLTGLRFHMSSVHRRAAIAHAVLRSPRKAKRCLDEAHSLDDVRNEHAKITTRVYQALCKALGRVDATCADPLKVLKTAPAIYLSGIGAVGGRVFSQ